MISAEDIQAAERTLQIVYGGHFDRSMEAFRVDLDAFNNFIQDRMGIIKRRYSSAWGEMDPRIEPALNTVAGHAFLVGVICGRNQIRSGA